MRFAPKRRYITADICYRIDEYRGIPPCELKKEFARRFSAAISACTARLAKDRVDFDMARFEEDIEKVYADLDLSIV